MVAQIGNLNADSVDADTDGIRLAQERVWGGRHIIQGPVLYDIDLEGLVHFGQPDDVELAAHRWAAAILGGVLGRDAGRTPRLVAAVLDDGDDDGDAGEVVLTADADLADGVDVDGFVVRSAGGEVPLESAVVEGRTVRLVLGEPVTGPLTVSLGAGFSAAGAAVPIDTSAWRLPMLPFLSRPVTWPPRSRRSAPVARPEGRAVDWPAETRRTAVVSLRSHRGSSRASHAPRRRRSIRTKHGGDAVGTQDPHSHG